MGGVYEVEVRLSSELPSWRGATGGTSGDVPLVGLFSGLRSQSFANRDALDPVTAPAPVDGEGDEDAPGFAAFQALHI